MSCPQFIVQSLAVRTAAHLMHLSARTYSQHVALSAFYEGLLPLVDSYAEVYMGLEGLVTAWPGPTTAERKDPIALLEDYLELIEAELEEDHGSEALKNILAELEQLTAQAVYKLRYLK